MPNPQSPIPKLISICLFTSFSLLSACSSQRILSFPFDNSGRSFNSGASELNPQISNRYIVYTSDRRGSQDVYLFDRVTRNLSNLPRLNSFDAIASHPSVSQDARYIVFAASRSGRSNIFLYDKETRQSRNLTGNLQAEVRNPTISADGSRIAFECTLNGQWDILVYDRFGRRLNIPQEPQ
ncbi:MAG: Tol biopolymer transporter periplasmic protein [Cyanobacteria bacterium P01_H01_bin.150]